MRTSFIARLRQRFASGSADSAKLKSSTAPSTGVFSRSAIPMVIGIAILGTFAAVGVHASTPIADSVALFFANMVFILVSFVGQLLLIMVGALIWVAQYNGFVNSAAVTQGWGIVRDITNMFFILVLLVLAFGTILGVEKWSYKGGALPRLLIMAVVVNFSRTICGLLIDFGQVVMLTFVYGFKEAAGGNFADAFGITKILQENPNATALTGFQIAVAMVLALAMTIISCLVVIGMTITLVMRIVYLWLLIVLSPLAFFLKAVPGSKASSYYSKWWGKFTGLVIVGPMMAFTLWLSLLAVATPNFSSNGFPSTASTGAGSEVVSGDASAAFAGDEIEKFIISICLLVAGWQMSQEISQETAGQAPGLAKKMGSGALKAGRAAYRGTMKTGDALTGGALTRGREDLLQRATAIPLVRGYAGKALGESRAERSKKDKAEASFMAGLSPEARKNFANAAAWTPDQKARKKEALRSSLKDSAEKPPTDEKGKQEFYKQRKALNKLGSEANDTSVKKDIADIEKKRPSLIIDPGERDSKERDRQEESFRKAARGLNASKINEMDANELDEKFLAFANPKAIIEARKNATGDQLEKLMAMGSGDKQIEAKQADLRAKPENFGILSAQDRAQLVGGKMVDGVREGAMSGDQLRALANNSSIRPEQLSGQVLEAAAAAGTAGAIADKVASQLSGDQLRANAGLADQISKGISAGSMSKLSADASEVLIPLVAQNDVGKALAGGARMDQAFSGYGADGSFDTPESRKKFEDFAKDGKNAGSVPADAINANGGVNDVSISMINNMNVQDLNSMAKDGKADQVTALLAAAEKMAGINTNDQATVDKFIVENPGVTSNEAELREMFTKAALLVAETSGKSHPVAAASRENDIWREAQLAEKASNRADKQSEKAARYARKLLRKQEKKEGKV